VTYSSGENPRVRLDPGAATSFLQQLRAALQNPSVCAITVEVGDVTRLEPAILQLLCTAGQEATVAGKELYIDGAGPVVYKALQLAKLGPLFKRLHHAVPQP
jgi:anti-anti-sigma regulatory factor